MLILNGANVNENNFHFDYSTPLHLGAKSGFEIILYLNQNLLTQKLFRRIFVTFASFFI